VLRWEVGKSFENAPLPWSVWGDMMLNLNPAVVGVILLVPGEVALSIWLFYVLYRLQLLGYAAAGLTGREGARLFAPVEFIHDQEAGGFLMLAVTFLWQSRGAIRRAVPSVRSSAESHPPRWPGWGFFACNFWLGFLAAG